MLKPVGKRALELFMKDAVSFGSFPDKEMYLCFLPELTGVEENMLIESTNNFLVLVYPMGVEFSENIVQSESILKRMERRRSKIVVYDDEMRKFQSYAFSKLLEIRDHLIYLLHFAYSQRSDLFLGREGVGMAYAKIKYDPVSAVESLKYSPWYVAGKEEVFSFSKYKVGHMVSPDLNEVFVVTFRE
ncbi:MAG: hypothetical protein QW364_03645 [Thermoplasmatales archaeon]